MPFSEICAPSGCSSFLEPSLARVLIRSIASPSLLLQVRIRLLLVRVQPANFSSVFVEISLLL